MSTTPPMRKPHAVQKTHDTAFTPIVITNHALSPLIVALLFYER